MLDDIFRNIGIFKQINFIRPVIDAVTILPKEELAELAFSLVSLTSLKRRMSMEQETVGGPIDVAVISKGDGFIWIKRKHYFSTDLNPQFVPNYFFDVTRPDGGKDGKGKPQKTKRARSRAASKSK